jgi:hypothetical protein
MSVGDPADRSEWLFGKRTPRGFEYMKDIVKQIANKIWKKYRKHRKKKKK